jgi:beta-glucosidase
MHRRKLLQYAALSTGTALLNPYQQLQALNRFLLKANELKVADFGQNFKWGVATAAYQIEGAHNIDGKKASVWDTFSHTKGKIKTGENGDITCNFYENYAQDIALVKTMNFKVFRFSLAWSRIFPNGIGEPNLKGVDFYNRVIDTCLELGVEPWITLYHWDLPQVLEDKGGWANREVVDWFSEYANFCTKTYGDRVKNWMVLNEPMAYTTLGYLSGTHAPGKKSPKKFLKAVHHTVLCQAEGGRIIRTNVPNANVGSTFSCSHVDAVNDKRKHKTAVKRMDALLNRLFIEPALGMGYPVDGFAYLKRIEKYMQEGDEEKMIFNFDFIGVQNYSRMVVKRLLLLPVVGAVNVPPKKLGLPKSKITEMNWEVYPEGIYKVLKQFNQYEGVDKIIVTENGASFNDVVTKNNEVHDTKRVQFFKDYLGYVLKAKKEGVNVQGYYVWTLMDNFEWAEGYKPRFGLVHVDFNTQKRIIKDSGRWFTEFLNKK